MPLWRLRHSGLFLPSVIDHTYKSTSETLNRFPRRSEYRRLECILNEGMIHIQ